MLVVGACIFGASMTSEANRIRLVETISGVRNTGDVAKMNNGEDREYSAGSFEEATQEIRNVLHIAVPELYYIPAGMEYSRTYISKETKLAIIQYHYREKEIYFRLSANDNDLSQSDWQDREKIQVETLDSVLDIEMGTISENDEENYYAKWCYRDAYYELSGQIDKEELMKILNEMQYNL